MSLRQRTHNKEEVFVSVFFCKPVNPSVQTGWRKRESGFDGNPSWVPFQKVNRKDQRRPKGFRRSSGFIRLQSCRNVFLSSICMAQPFLLTQ